MRKRKNKWGMTPGDVMVTEFVFGFLFKIVAYGLAIILTPFFYFYIVMGVLLCIKAYVEAGMVK